MSDAETETSGDAARDFAVVDDYSAQEQWRERVAQELADGRSPEDVAAGLVAEDWAAEQAAEFVELVRWETRDERGVITRDRVARMAKGDGRLSPLGIFGLGTIGHLFRLRASLALLKKLGTCRRGQSAESAPAGSPPDSTGDARQS